MQINSSWCVRVDRDELFELQVDGTEGSAVAGLRECQIQPAANTPMPVWNPDIPSPIDYRAAWQRVPDRGEPRQRASRSSGRCSCATSRSTSRSPGISSRRAKGVQLAELGLQSWEERRFVEVPELAL